MDANSVLLANASVRVKRTRYGVMAYNINDMYVGRSLDCYGEYVPGPMSLLSQLAPSGSIALDVGANIGAITLVLSGVVGPRGMVVARCVDMGVREVCASKSKGGDLSGSRVRNRAPPIGPWRPRP